MSTSRALAIAALVLALLSLVSSGYPLLPLAVILLAVAMLV